MEATRRRRLSLAGIPSEIHNHARGIHSYLQKSPASAPVPTLFVFDEDTAALFGEDVPARVVLARGEAGKSLGEIGRILDAAVEAELPRRGRVVGVGGGAVTDTAALAASLYMRGVSLVLVPTTLLAMVDAAIGGKTGVNYRGYKNMVGTFYPAAEVAIFLDALDSLGDREFRSGLAELIKAGLLRDPAILESLEGLARHTGVAAGAAIPTAAATSQDTGPGASGPLAALRRETDRLLDLVDRAVAVKAAIVEEDFREQGVRAHLNLGHTFAHALESAAGFGAFTHGDAVAWGICRGLDLGVLRGVTSPAYRDRVTRLLSSFGFPTGPVAADPDALIAAMYHDKKRSGEGLPFVLQRDLADTTIQHLPEAEVRRVLADG